VSPVDDGGQPAPEAASASASPAPAAAAPPASAPPAAAPPPSGAPRPELDPALLEILRDPADRSRLSFVEETGAWYLEGASGNRYPITDGIPVLLVDAAHRVAP